MNFASRLRSRSATAFLLAALFGTAPAPAAVDLFPTEGRHVYRLAVGHAGNTPFIVGATWDERLCAFDAEGNHRWDAPLGGFAFDVNCFDLDGDGRDEVLAAGADGTLACFSSDGRPIWRHSSPAPLQQVTVARLDGRNPVVLTGGMTREILLLSAAGRLVRTIPTERALGNIATRLLRAGDFDGDGCDEVAVMGLRGRGLEVRFLDGEELRPLPGEYTIDGLRTANGTVADLDGDGTVELLVGTAILSLKSQPASRSAAGNPGRAEKAPRSPAKRGKSGGSAGGGGRLPAEPRPASYDYHYRMRSLAAGDFTAAPGREIAVLDGPDLQLAAADGRVLGAAHASVTFADAVRLPGAPRDSLLLASGLGGDDALYRVTFAPGWEKALAHLPRSAQRQALAGNTATLARQAATWRGTPMAGADGPLDVVVTHHMWAGAVNLQTVDAWIDEVKFFERQFPYPGLRFSTCVWPAEKRPLLRPDGQEWPFDHRLAHNLTREQLLAVARKFEQARCPFWIQVGHGCAPHLSAASALAMLAAAPTMCLGFVSAEDEQADQMAYYFEHHIGPLLEACLAQGKRFIPRNKNVWWAHWPADPTLRRLVFNGRYRSVILPCVEDSNSRTADAQLAARVGLWLDGQVDDWACRLSADWFSFNRAWEWEAVKTGHPHLRYLTAQTFLGARVFMLLAGDRERRGGAWTRVGSEGVAPFLHLLGRGAIAPPRRDQLRGIAPVVLQLPRASERFARHGANGHGYHRWNSDGTDRQPWAFDRLDCYWGMAPLPPTDVSTYLWGRTRRAADHLPVTTPHGFVCLLPGPDRSARGPWTTVWTTDGDGLSRGGQTFNLEAGRAALTADLAAAADRLPFRVAGRVFWQAVAQPDGGYILCLLDPGWVDPAPRTAVVQAQAPGVWRVRDRLSGEDHGALGPAREFTVPAGLFLLLELSSSQP